jgi:hypothetical protein
VVVQPPPAALPEQHGEEDGEAAEEGDSGGESDEGEAAAATAQPPGADRATSLLSALAHFITPVPAKAAARPQNLPAAAATPDEALVAQLVELMVEGRAEEVKAHLFCVPPERRQHLTAAVMRGIAKLAEGDL